MKRLTLLCTLAFVGVFLLHSCQDETALNPSSQTLNLPSVEFNYAATVPAHVAPNLHDNTPGDNAISDAGATLGRVLFYDKKMSKNNAIACASCHHQQLGFADKAAKSTGFEGLKTTRNSMAICNLRFHENFFWDTNDITLEEQVLEPLKNHIEMGMEDLGFLETKLQQTDYYPALFKAAFGSEEITSERVSKAMAQFLRSMTSYDSKFDKGVATNFDNLTELEMMGKELFEDHQRTGCEDCHAIRSNFAATWRRNANIGLDMNYEDEGAGGGRFKIPTLRNIALTAPYMHDGRYNTLEEVIDHYSDNIQNHPELDWALKDFNNGGAKRMNLSPIEKRALVAFLETLTDESFTSDPKFSNPFQ